MRALPSPFSRYAASSDGTVLSLRRSGRERGGRRGGFIASGYKALTGRVIDGYVRVNLTLDDGSVQSVGVHRLVALAFLGNPPDGFVCDHMDGNRANNAIGNLRYLKIADNARNAKKTKKKTLSRFKGVTFNRSANKWQASIGIGRGGSSGGWQKKHLGVFEAEDDAARAYDAAAVSLWGHAAKTNFSMGLLA